MTIQSDIREDFSDVLDLDFNKELSFGAQTGIRCFQAKLEQDQIPTTAGYQDRYVSSFYTPFEDWTGALPVPESDRVTFEGTEYLVIGVAKSGLDIYYRIDYTEKYG